MDHINEWRHWPILDSAGCLGSHAWPYSFQMIQISLHIHMLHVSCGSHWANWMIRFRPLTNQIDDTPWSIPRFGEVNILMVLIQLFVQCLSVETILIQLSPSRSGDCHMSQCHTRTLPVFFRNYRLPSVSLIPSVSIVYRGLDSVLHCVTNGLLSGSGDINAFS